MAVTRSMLKGMGLTDEHVSAVIEAHTETLEGLKKERDQYKADAEKLPNVQKELDDLKAGTDWKAEHDKLKKAFDDYKVDITNKETLGKVKAAYRKLLDAKKINEADAELIMAGTKFDSMQLKDDGSLDNSDNLTKDIETKYARYIPSTDTRGANVDTPPSGNNGTGANPRAAAVAKQFYERRYGKTPENGAGTNDNK